MSDDNKEGVAAPGCKLGCTEACKAKEHGCASECPSLPWQPAAVMPAAPSDAADAARWRFAMDWGTKDFAVCYRDGNAWVPIKNNGPIDAALSQTMQPQAGADHSQLMKFYGVDSVDALIVAQADHIEKLQDRLPRNTAFTVQRVREG